MAVKQAINGTQVNHVSGNGKSDTVKKVDHDCIAGEDDLKDCADLNDFVWVMHDEPHASRRKEFIKNHPEVKELMGHEPKTKYIVIALMAIQIGIGIYLKDEPGSWRFWLLAYIVGGTISQALFLACHEISHNLAFRKFSHNRLFGIFANMPMLIPFFMYFKYYHNEHHKYQGVEGIDTDLPTTFEAKLLSNFFGKLFFLSFQIYFYAFRPVLVKTPVITVWHGLNYLVQFSFIAGIVYNFGWGPILYFLASISFAGSLHPVASHFIAEHYVFKEDAETYSYYGPLNFITWNVGYHNEHHDFPTVPWSKLPSLYQLGKRDYYSKLPYHKSWTKVMLSFLFSPHMSLFNRVKRKDNYKEAREKDVDKAAEYTGDWLNGTGWKGEAKVVKQE